MNIKLNYDALPVMTSLKHTIYYAIFPGIEIELKTISPDC